MFECLIVGLGGFIGSIARYLIGLIPINETNIFPINTFMINIIGSIVIGLIAFYLTKNNSYNDNIILFLKMGVCGGFTTFSTFALETGDLIKSGNTEIAFMYVLLSVIVGVCAIFLPELIYNKITPL
ncbi:MAG: fluoride efflux transporter CrcB [Methanosphaera stadtmanae]|nr:fluoride efflux transporter CrcB [Methanosphaera stadtmanae]